MEIRSLKTFMEKLCEGEKKSIVTYFSEQMWPVLLVA